MAAKLVIASLLAGTSVAASGQPAAGRADASAAVGPLMHQCNLSPVGSSFAINTKGTGANSGRAAGGATTGWSRIDLHLAGPPGGGAGPTITAFAINTQGTGTSSGRAIKIEIGAAGQKSGEVRNQIPIGIDCVKSVVAGDEAAQKASLASFAFMSADGKGLGWSCSVSGSEEKPQFVVGLLVPTILGQAERSAAPGATARSEWSWGVSNSTGRVSIVPRSAENNDSWHVACTSKESGKYGYDLAVLKKP